MKNSELRLVTLSDGTGMGDELLVFETNAPVEKLKELEKKCCDIYINGGGLEDIPIWADVLSQAGYIFDFIDSHPHVNPFNTSSEWIEDKYPNIKENYVIENQPEVR